MSFLLLQDGSYLLLQDGSSRLILEPDDGSSTSALTPALLSNSQTFFTAIVANVDTFINPHYLVLSEHAHSYLPLFIGADESYGFDFSEILDGAILASCIWSIFPDQGIHTPQLSAEVLGIRKVRVTVSGTPEHFGRQYFLEAEVMDSNSVEHVRTITLRGMWP